MPVKSTVVPAVAVAIVIALLVASCFIRPTDAFSAATFWFVVHSCEPFTASVLVDETAPAATLVIFVLDISAPALKVANPDVVVAPFSAIPLGP
ncbi:hypothetical protein R75465_03598 [Paraburkholderia aspalathi]|nr:hypothetical protein R75465_03598 [Paraburkholderia aspalathi]